MNVTAETRIAVASELFARGNYRAAKQALIPVLREEGPKQEAIRLLATIYERDGQHAYARLTYGGDADALIAFESRLHDSLQNERMSLPRPRRLMFGLLLFLVGGVAVVLAFPNSLPLELLELWIEQEWRLFDTFAPVIRIGGMAMSAFGIIVVALWAWPRLIYRRHVAKAYPPASFIGNSSGCGSCGLPTPSRRCIHCGIKAEARVSGANIKYSERPEVDATRIDDLENVASAAKEPVEQPVEASWWWIDQGGTRVGPCSASELSEAASLSRFNSQTMVWRKGEEWKRAKDVPSLDEVLQHQTPSPSKGAAKATDARPFPVGKLLIFGVVAVTFYLLYNGKFGEGGKWLGGERSYASLVRKAESDRAELIANLKAKHGWEDLDKAPSDFLEGALGDIAHTLTEYAANIEPPSIKVADGSVGEITEPEIGTPTVYFSTGALAMEFPLQFTLKGANQSVRIRGLDSNNAVLTDSIVLLPGEVTPGQRVAAVILLSDHLEQVAQFELYVKTK